jgi:hypothetical protein
VVTLYLGSKLNAGLITSTPILNMGLTAEAASIYCYVLDWDVDKTNFPDSRNDAQLISPYSVPLTPVGGGK